MAKVKFTAGRIAEFSATSEAIPAFFWDSGAPGLGIRVTPAGAKSYIFQAKLNGKVIRITIGAPDAWELSAAQAEARRLKVIVDKGEDPRQVHADEIQAKQTVRDQHAAKKNAAEKQAARESVTVNEVWTEYLKARKSKWSSGHYDDHIANSSAGGQDKKRGKGKTMPGALAALLPVRLADLTSGRIASWLETESLTRPTAAALSYRMLRAFIRWTEEQPDYQGIIPSNAYSARTVRDVLPKPQTKEGDSLQREQLPLWFEAVRKIPNPVASAYLQALLLTGARREEMAALRWADVDFQWKGLTIHDKIEGMRVIPLTPYLASLLGNLPRRNEWVFSAPDAESGRITEPRYAHSTAIEMAGLPHLSIHGLRRSFGTLCEWVDMPAGISAQIMGHKPSAIAEKHYRRRPLDLLRVWHEKIEAWILEQAGIAFVPAQPGLRVITAA